MFEKLNLTQGVADKDQEHFRVSYTMTQASNQQILNFSNYSQQPYLKTTHTSQPFPVIFVEYLQR